MPLTKNSRKLFDHQSKHFRPIQPSITVFSAIRLPGSQNGVPFQNYRCQIVVLRTAHLFKAFQLFYISFTQSFNIGPPSLSQREFCPPIGYFWYEPIFSCSLLSSSWAICSSVGMIIVHQKVTMCWRHNTSSWTKYAADEACYGSCCNKQCFCCRYLSSCRLEWHKYANISVNTIDGRRSPGGPKLVHEQTSFLVHLLNIIMSWP